MTLSELVCAEDWQTVAAELLSMDASDAVFLPSFERMFEALRAIDPEPNDTEIIIRMRQIPGLDVVPIREAVGVPTDGVEPHSLAFSPWALVSGMSVCDETVSAFGSTAVVGQVLIELATHGFTEADSRAVLHEVRRRMG